MASPSSAQAASTRSTPRLPEIDPQRCTGCGRCVAACAPRVLSLEVANWRKFSALGDATQCTGCSDCAIVCPFHAITMRTPPERNHD